jgi:tRNA(adenine34) deaminase
MCLGAAMALAVSEVCLGLASPADGAAGIAESWKPNSPDLPGYAAPVMVGGVRKDACRDQFRRYCRTAPDSGFRRWAQTIADLPG